MMKDDAIRQSMASIENRVRHIYNQGFEAGRKAERKTGRWIATDKAIEIIRKYLGYSDGRPYDTVDAIIEDIMDEADKEGAEE